MRFSSAAVLPFLALVLFFQLMTSALVPQADEVVYLQHAWRLSAGLPVRPDDATIDSMKQFARYPPGQSLWLAPFAAITRWATGLREYDAGAPAAAWWLLRLSGSVLAALSVLYFAAMMRLLGMRRGAFLGGFLLMTATCAWVYTRNFYSEALQLWALLAAVFHAHRLGVGKGRSLDCVVLFVALVLAPISKVTAGWILPLAWILALRGGSYLRATVVVAASGFTAIGLILWFNWAKFDDPFYMGYDEGQGFTTPWYVGTLGLLLSPGRGLLIGSPILLAALWGFPRLWRMDRLLAGLLLAGAGFHVVLHGSWWVWFGGWCWGPRLAVPIIPLLMIPAWLQLAAMATEGWRALSRYLAIALVALSLTMQVPAVLIYYMDFMRVAWLSTYKTFPTDWVAEPKTRDLETLLHWVPELSQIPGHWWFLELAWEKRMPMKSRPPWDALAFEPWRVTTDEPPPRIDWWPMAVWQSNAQRTGIVFFVLLFAGGVAVVTWLDLRRPRLGEDKD